MMCRRGLTVCLLFVLVVSGCKTTEQQQPELPALLEAVSTRPPGGDTLTILDRLPPAREVDVAAHENRHDTTQTDTVRTYIYDGLTYTVYTVSASGKEMIQHIEVTGPGYATEEGLRVGLSRVDVQDIRGTPDERPDGNFVYRLSDVVPSTLTVFFQDDTVSAMEWDFYVD